MKNKKIVRVGIVGVAGKMGKAIASLAIKDPEMLVKGGSEYPKHRLIGKDIGLILGEKSINIPITSSLKSFFNNLDVVIEFGLEDATIMFLKEASRQNVAFLSGSTGLSSGTLKLMKKLSKNIPILWSPNMSIGANILKETSGELAFKLANDFDIDITDIHHKKKRDIPSGTALSIKESIDQLLKNNNLKKKINISAIRAGDSTGEHSVIFSGKGERIVIKHISTSRDIFAQGAIKISKWLYKQKRGFYNMKDYLAIKR